MIRNKCLKPQNRKISCFSFLCLSLIKQNKTKQNYTQERFSSELVIAVLIKSGSLLEFIMARELVYSLTISHVTSRDNRVLYVTSLTQVSICCVELKSISNHLLGAYFVSYSNTMRLPSIYINRCHILLFKIFLYYILDL